MKRTLEETLGKRKAEIVAATLKLADHSGIRGITTKKIAQEVGFVEGALYKHVKSKGEVFALVLEISEILIQKVFQEIEEKKLTADESLRAWFEFAISYLEDFPGVYRILFSDELYVENKEFFIKFKEITQMMKDGFTKIVTQGVTEGVFRRVKHPDLIAILYLGVIHTSFIMWNLFEERKQRLAELAAPILEEFLDSLIISEA